jgi:hypothetical protein
VFRQTKIVGNCLIRHAAVEHAKQLLHALGKFDWPRCV